MILRFLMLMWWASTASNDATGPSGPSGGSVTFVGSPTPGSSSAQSTSNQTPCDQELGPEDGSGRYPTLIVAEFTRNTVFATGRKRNLFCKCFNADNMICFIVLFRNTPQEHAIDDRLNRDNRESLRPFFVAPQQLPLGEYPIFYENSECSPPVYAEIRLERDAEHFIENLENQERKLKHMITVQSLPVNLCSPTHCSITGLPLRRHDVVYVLISDSQKVKRKEAVRCISSDGLRKLERAAGELPGQPKRDEEKTTAELYKAYVISEDLPPREADGSCSATSVGPWSNFVLSLSSPESSDRNVSPGPERLASSIIYTSNFWTYFSSCLLFCIFTYFVHLKRNNSNYSEVEYYSEL